MADNNNDDSCSSNASTTASTTGLLLSLPQTDLIMKVETSLEEKKIENSKRLFFPYKKRKKKERRTCIDLRVRTLDVEGAAGINRNRS